MDYIYLDTLIPFRPKLAPGESLTSLLFRVAGGMSCSIEEVLVCLGAKDPSTARRCGDFELGVVDEVLLRLSRATGNSLEVLRASTFYEFLEYTETANDALHGVPKTSWIMLPARARVVSEIPEYRNQRQVLGGFQYCPTCLRSKHSILPLAWRYSFVTVCPEHKTLLLASCPHCKRDIDFKFKTNVGKLGDGLRRARSCRYCEGDLARQGPAIEEERPFTSHQIQQLASFQELTILLLDVGIKRRSGLVKEYFTGLEWLISLHLPRRRQITRGATSFGHLLSLMADVRAFRPPRFIPQGPYTFRLYSPEDRATLLLMTMAILDPWPEHFLGLRITPFLGNELSWSGHLPSFFVDPKSGQIDSSSNQLGSSLAHSYTARYLPTSEPWEKLSLGITDRRTSNACATKQGSTNDEQGSYRGELALPR